MVSRLLGARSQVESGRGILHPDLSSLLSKSRGLILHPEIQVRIKVSGIGISKAGYRTLRFASFLIVRYNNKIMRGR
jgi:hypothetical protein